MFYDYSKWFYYGVPSMKFSWYGLFILIAITALMYFISLFIGESKLGFIVLTLFSILFLIFGPVILVNTADVNNHAYEISSLNATMEKQYGLSGLEQFNKDFSKMEDKTTIKIEYKENGTDVLKTGKISRNGNFYALFDDDGKTMNPVKKLDYSSCENDGNKYVDKNPSTNAEDVVQVCRVKSK